MYTAAILCSNGIVVAVRFIFSYAAAVHIERTG